MPQINLAGNAGTTPTAKPPAKPKSKIAAAAAAGDTGGGGVTQPTLSPIEQQAQSEIDPIIAAITAEINAHTAAADAAIKGYTDSYAKQLGGIDYTAPYQTAEGQQASVDAALQQALTGGGSGLAAGLSDRLKALDGTSGAGALAQESGNLASQGSSAGTTRVASGSAALGNLLANAAAAGTYGEKMPGIADLTGLQNIGKVEGAAQQAIASGTTAAEGKLPDIVQQLKSDKLAQQSLAATKQYHQLEAAIAGARANAYITGTKARINQGQQRINQGAQRLAISANRDAVLNKLSVLNYGLSAQRLQIEQQKAMQTRKASGMTPYELSNLRQKAAKDLQSYYHGVAAKYETGPNGSRVLVSGTGPGSALTYQQAIKSLILSYPALGPKQIINMADKLYAPGEGGRPSGKQAKLGMFSGLAQTLFGGAPVKGGVHGGKADYGVTQGIGANVGDAIGGKLATSSNAGGFLPKGIKFTYDRHDQGRDIQTTPGAPILAPGDGYVVRIGSNPWDGNPKTAGGFFGPAYPIVHFTTGPYAGMDVYIGHTLAAVKPGQKFTAGTVLSRTQKSGLSNGGAPSGWAEIGFAPGGTPGAFDQPAPF